MKKGTFLVFCCLLWTTTTVLGQSIQETDTIKPPVKNHEVKLNSVALIAHLSVQVSYEYLLNKESSAGMGLLFKAGEISNSATDVVTFMASPYYRRYFSKHYAKGFFIEGFGALYSFKENYNSYTNFALGIGVGGKFVTHDGFLAEISLGVGRSLTKNHPSYTLSEIHEIVGRFAISVGYRF